MLPRRGELPIEAVGSLLEVVGIMVDHDVDTDHERLSELEHRLRHSWEPEEWAALRGPDKDIELEIEDAAILLHGLAVTEMMSAEFPWFELLQWVTEFVTANLRERWTDDEWRSLG